MAKVDKIVFDLKGIREIFASPAVEVATEKLANEICETANELSGQYAQELWPGREFDVPFFHVLHGTTRYGSQAYSVSATGELGDELQARYSVLTKAMASHGVELAYGSM